MDGNFNIDSLTDDFTHNAVIQTVKDNWDYFCEVGEARPILDFEFCIDNGNSKAICYRQPKYGVHEATIMSKKISDLEHNKWIRDCSGPWVFYYSCQLNRIRNLVPTLISLFEAYVLVTELLMLYLDHSNSQTHVALIVLRILGIRTGNFTLFTSMIAPSTIRFELGNVIRKS